MGDINGPGECGWDAKGRDTADPLWRALQSLERRSLAAVRAIELQLELYRVVGAPNLLYLLFPTGTTSFPPSFDTFLHPPLFLAFDLPSQSLLLLLSLQRRHAFVEQLTCFCLCGI